MARAATSLLLCAAALLLLAACDSVVCIGGALTPSIRALSPAAATAGGAQFTLIVTGDDFTAGAAVEWNGQPHRTTFVGATELRATIVPADIAAPGAAQVRVVAASSGTLRCSANGSNLVVFTIN